MNLIDSKKALSALAATAAVLPNIAQADSPAESIVIGYKHHKYTEKDASATQTGNQKVERYEIDVNQFQLLLPLSDKYQLNFDYQTETMSGASPWYTYKAGDGTVRQVMSGASIKDTRDDIKVSLSTYTQNSTLTLGVANSSEDDYDANSVFASYSHTTDDKMQTYGISVDYSDDTVDPVDKDAFTPQRVDEQDKNSLSLMLSTTQVINRNMLWQVSAGFIEKEGYLSDPYKLVDIVDPVDNSQRILINDQRPKDRFAWLFTSSTRNYVESMQAAAHVDYRYYQDNWDLSSHTIELKWLQTIAKDWRLIPSFRYYTQTATDFYQTYYESDRPQKYYSNDYRLSSYGAITLGLKVETKIDDWLLNISYESYRSDGSYGLESENQDNPGLVDFDILSLGFYYSFN
ncbi:DUF3570 domain-containing protein [Thalassomonas sp. M1454]|uniref:DUF3570 domain-containing protein n=1 Tax=Thalassomonas sp. M1454 TaxID=2594477 RepID=UPI00117E480E|nr:DUF3570 domain-containing protein [Thalassomonas sp. M1454]TRX55803.1 DUF3570 domain-containing protein [Thalassomonas sp. M1454]